MHLLLCFYRKKASFSGKKTNETPLTEPRAFERVLITILIATIRTNWGPVVVSYWADSWAAFKKMGKLFWTEEARREKEAGKGKALPSFRL